MSQRLFTFGCSFTQYKWPTWADILGQQFNHYENWGRVGAGNQFIFNSLIECQLKNQLTQTDTVGIMWTNVAREDRYVNNEWVIPGNIYTQTTYSQDFIKKFCDIRGYYIRDLATIHATKLLLDHIGCQYFFLSMVPVLNHLQYDNVTDTNEVCDDLLPYYQETLDIVHPSIFEVVFNNDWWSRPFMQGDLSIVEAEYNKNAGGDWPTFSNFIQQKFDGISKKILKEIFDTTRWNWNQMIHRACRPDSHPTPLEHLEYIDRVLPNYTISDGTRNWCANMDSLVKSGQETIGKSWDQHLVKRW